MRQAIQELQPQGASRARPGLPLAGFSVGLMTLGGLLGVHQTFGEHTPGLLVPVLGGAGGPALLSAGVGVSGETRRVGGPAGAALGDPVCRGPAPPPCGGAGSCGSTISSPAGTWPMTGPCPSSRWRGPWGTCWRWPACWRCSAAVPFGFSWRGGGCCPAVWWGPCGPAATLGGTFSPLACSVVFGGISGPLDHAGRGSALSPGCVRLAWRRWCCWPGTLWGGSTTLPSVDQLREDMTQGVHDLRYGETRPSPG